MKLGIVTGVVWSSRKVEELKGCRLSIVQPINSSGEFAGNSLVVADPQNLGAEGDRVIYVSSADAAEAFKNGYAPVNASIVELVDGIV